MDREDLFKKITTTNEKKLVMIVLDGIGGLPLNGLTELEAASTPNLDKLAKECACGLTHPIGLGITPGSGPAHLSLFGYDPLRYEIGRGILEALGIGVTVGPSDLAIRGNFATLKDGLIVDRRAGRISTDKNREIIRFLSEQIKEVNGVEVKLFSGEEHRFVVLLSGRDLSDAVTDADPEITDKPIAYSKARSREAEKSALVINTFIDRLTEVLKDHYPANTCLLRGVAKYPDIPSMSDLFKLKPAAVAVYPMYRGLAQLVGMDILKTGKKVKDQLATVKEYYNNYDFFFVHVKKTDSFGEDGDFEEKVGVIEEFDQILPQFLTLSPDVLVITGDHSTPAIMKSHSWHPNPFLLKAPFIRQNPVVIEGFSEKGCGQGVLGQFNSVDILPLMLANAQKLKKYGA